MGRNLDRRVELMFPLEDPVWREFIKRETLDDAWRDNVAARVLDLNGAYTRRTPTGGEPTFELQEYLMQSRVNQEPKKAVPRESPQEA